MQEEKQDTNEATKCLLCIKYGGTFSKCIKPPYLFVYVEVLRPSQPSGVMSSAVSLPNHTFTWQA